MLDTDTFLIGEPIDLLWAPWTAEEISLRQLARVELEVDGVAMTGVPTPTPIPSEAYTFRVPPERLTIGTHVLRGRACRADFCDAWSEVTITISPLAPGLLKDLRAHAATVPVTLEQAIAMAHAYGELAGGRHLTDAELSFLAAHYTGPLTRADILDFLDTSYTKLTEGLL